MIETQSRNAEPAGTDVSGLTPKSSAWRIFKDSNWPLFWGGLISLFMLLIAIWGPRWAPHDPMQENYALSVNGKIVSPPYSPLALPDYPLGTDQFGRDMLSRILWGVRPTLIMVGIVAATRLIFGVVLGFLIGWSTGVSGRILDTLLFVALSIPILIVALMGITAVGVHKGIWAFIFGLAITGWAETARVISTQTRALRGQVFIEAAQALGASESRVFFKHVIPQVAPLVWMLLAFEVSATVFVISELGFLGYYIGGGVWIEVSDFVSVNTTGLPELGQMLSTALITLVKPLGLIVVGTFIFITILGFNLLGEGLRLQYNRKVRAGYTRTKWIGGKLGEWLDEKVSQPSAEFVEDHTRELGLLVLVIVLSVGWSIWWNSRPQAVPASEQQWLSVSGGHLWATMHHDAQGTRWAPVEGPQDASVAWTYLSEGGLVGGPVVSKDGNIYLTSADKKLISLDPTGTLNWQRVLEETPVRFPALGPGGEVYVTDARGGLSAFGADGNTLWRFQPQTGREATSSPIVASNGTIYYTRLDSIQAVSPAGEPMWLAFAHSGYLDKPPVLSAGESYLFLDDSALVSSNGARLALRGLPIEDLKFSLPVLFTGADLKSYLRTGHEVFGWVLTEDGVKVDPVITWNYENQVVVPPYDQGVTPDGTVWLFYSGEYFDTRLVWLGKDSKVLDNLRPADRQSELIAIDRQSRAYICSDNFNANANCKVYEIGSAKPLWELKLGAGLNILGGALIDGWFYVSTDTGLLYAIGTGESNENVEGLQTESTQPPGAISGDIGMTTPTAMQTTAKTPTNEASSPTSTPEIETNVEHILFIPIIYR